MRKRLTFYVLRMTPLKARPTLALRRSPQTTPTSIYEAENRKMTAQIRVAEHRVIRVPIFIGLRDPPFMHLLRQPG